MGSVRLFKTGDATQIANKAGHKDQMHAVAASPRGDVCASADDKGVVRLWSVPDLSPLRTWDLGGGRVDGLVFSRDGGVLHIGSSDGAIRRVSIDTGASLPALRAHQKGIVALSRDADGRALVSAGRDGRILEWDLKGGFIAGRLRADPSEILSTVVSPDGRWIAAGGTSGTVRVWQRGSGALPWFQFEASKTKLFALAWHPTKPLLAWSGVKGTAGILELARHAPKEQPEK